VKVVVEIAAKRRNPGDAPSPLRFISVEHGQGGSRHHHERRVALLEERQIAQGVDPSRAARTPVRLPCRVEHEVLDDELATAEEEIPETPLDAASKPPVTDRPFEQVYDFLQQVSTSRGTCSLMPPT
jgi:hypothetical protein